MIEPIKAVENDLSQVKLRLCYISNPNLIHTRRWISWFAQHGHTVCLLADVPLKEVWSDVQVIDLSKIFYARFVRFPIWTAWLRNFLREWRPDILHAHRINSAGWVAAACGFHPYVVTPWGTDIFVQPHHSLIARILARYTLRHADLITTLSLAMDIQAIQLGARPNTLRRVQFGVELDTFKPGLTTSQESLDLRKSLSLSENARVVLSPRAVTPLYNLDIIMKSIPLVRERVPEAIFIFLDYNTDVDYKKQLDMISKELGLDAVIRWLPPTRSRTEMAKLYRLSEVVVSVPSTDGTPISVLEAMACGKPVVCTDLLPLREFIISGENGWLVPVCQTSPLAEAILMLLTQPEQANEFGRKAYKVVAEKANREVEMQRMEAIYQHLTASRRR